MLLQQRLDRRELAAKLLQTGPLGRHDLRVGAGHEVGVAQARLQAADLPVQLRLLLAKPRGLGRRVWPAAGNTSEISKRAKMAEVRVFIFECQLMVFPIRPRTPA